MIIISNDVWLDATGKTTYSRDIIPIVHLKSAMNEKTFSSVSFCDSRAKATHIYYWCICKIAAIYFMTTFILLEYYKLESSRGKVHIAILCSEQKYGGQNCTRREELNPESQILNPKFQSQIQTPNPKL